MNKLRQLFCLFYLLKMNAASAQTDSLHLIFAGDIMGHGPMISAAKKADGSYNYDSFFKFVKPLLDEADFAIGNLELTLPGYGPYTGYPQFRSPDALADALKNAGFDMIVTSNNHSNDGGLNGVTHTIDVLREREFQQTGTFKNREERDIFYPLVLYIKGFKLVFLNYTYDTNGIPDHAPSIVNRIDSVEMKKDFAIARAFAPDFIIPIMHWGLEYQLKANNEQRFWANKMTEWGADMIVGMHPHVVQPIENQVVTLPDGSQKAVVTAWSLGNFISNQSGANTDGGIVFHAFLTKKKGAEKAELDDFGYSTVWRFMPKTNGKPDYFAVPTADRFLRPAMSEISRVALEKFEKLTTTRMGNVRKI
jgi:poly-gamma-glutamate capsule biosynthesis protein CapA/YwtB (metallophosphatase superfamily)